mmetsp:Transcript_92614/g.239161  ORF Transcript_92614/g.239161 Transcript_92614/m.239161 type:complete len:80 (-) Transcript_92614:193-432(-)
MSQTSYGPTAESGNIIDQAKQNCNPTWPRALFMSQVGEDATTQRVLQALRFYACCRKEDLVTMMQAADSLQQHHTSDFG